MLSGARVDELSSSNWYGAPPAGTMLEPSGEIAMSLTLSMSATNEVVVTVGVAVTSIRLIVTGLNEGS